MSTIRVKRGLEANRSIVTPAEGELIYTTDNKELFVGDGSTAGGIAIGKSPASLLTDIKSVDGSGSGLDADLLDGLQRDNLSTINTVASRDGSGDIQARLFRSEYDSTNPTINYVMTQIDTATNNYIRPSTIAQLRTSLNVENGSTGDQSAAEILALLLTVDGAGSGLDADTLDGIASSSFIRSNAADTATGSITFTSDSKFNAAINARLGMNGSYGVDSGSGTNWGSTIWGLGPSYDGNNSGTSYVPTSVYGCSWLRSAHANANGSIGEGLYVYQNGSLQGGIGTTGIYASGIIRATGDITAFYSDARLKDIEKPVTGAIDSIMNWNAVHYTANQTAGDLGYDMEIKQVGLLTQDVEIDYPEFVKDAPINDENGTDFKTLDYARIVAVLTAGMQEQQEMIKSLQDRLTTLES